ncbi:MAG: arsenate reductase ArsC [Solirubrobacterales bacterium]
MRYVLFVCTQNAGRSQIAQSFFERYGPEEIKAESAGQEPAREVHPVVLEAMAEVGFDLSERVPKKLTVEMQIHADWAITLACGGQCPYVPTVVEDWEIPDPAGRSLEEVRVIRDQIDYRVRDLVESRGDEILSDNTAHQMRLARILPSLDREFGGSRDPEMIRACADAILSRYDDVPIRTHIVTLAQRKITECLRAERCDALAQID